MNDRYLIIGSNSFSGGHFASYIAKQGVEVYGISRSEKADPIFSPEIWHFDTEIDYKFLQLDLNKDLEEIKKLIDHFQPSVVVNFAAQGMVAESWDNPLDWYKTNLMSQVALHEYLRKTSFLRKYIHITTPEVYGNNSEKIKEGARFDPSTPYAVSRAACDLHLRSFFNAYQFPVIFTRAANVYGEGQQLYRIIPRALVAARTGHKFALHGGGASVRSFIHINDVVEATFKICESSEIGETFHISTKTFISIYDLVEKIAQMFNKNLLDICFIDNERLGKDSAYMLDSTKVRDKFQWSDKIALEQGLQRVDQWVSKNFSQIRRLSTEYNHKE